MLACSCLLQLRLNLATTTMLLICIYWEEMLGIFRVGEQRILVIILSALAVSGRLEVVYK